MGYLWRGSPDGIRWEACGEVDALTSEGGQGLPGAVQQDESFLFELVALGLGQGREEQGGVAHGGFGTSHHRAGEFALLLQDAGGEGDRALVAVAAVAAADASAVDGEGRGGAMVGGLGAEAGQGPLSAEQVGGCGGGCAGVAAGGKGERRDEQDQEGFFTVNRING